MESSPTHLVHLSGISDHQAQRLRNGHACRCALGSKGEGFSAHLDEDNIKKLIKAGKKGAKATIRMAKHVIDKNKSEGTGICGGKIGKVNLKKVGKTIRKVGKSKPVQAIKKVGIAQGATMAKGALTNAGVPAPLAEMAVNYGAKKLDKATGGKLISAKKVGRTLRKVGKSKPAQAIKKQVISKGGDKVAGYLEDQGVPKFIARGAVKAGAKKLDKATGGALGGYGLGGYGFPNRVMGGAIGPGSRVTNVGAGGDLLGPANPALRSQAGSSNFFFHTQFPPGMAASIVNGSGLYA